MPEDAATATPPNAADTGGSDYGPYDTGQAPPDLAAQRTALAQKALAAVQSARPDIAFTPTPAAPAAGAPAAAPQLPLENANQELENFKRESWGAQVYHGILSAMGGKYDTQYIPTENGVVAKQVAQTPGQQWKRIISGALVGLGGAEAAGTQGPGGIARGLGGGIQAGYGERVREDQQKQQTANTQFSQDQEAAMNTARKSIAAAQVAESAWRLSSEKKQAYQSDLAAEANLMKMYDDAKEDGAIDLGVMPTFQDAVSKFKNDPTLHDSHSQGQIIPIPHVNAAGTIDGVHAIWVPKQWQERKATEDYTYMNLTGYDNKGKPTFEPMTVGKSTGYTNGQVQDIKLANANRQLEFHAKQVQADVEERKTNLLEQAAPGQRALTWAEAEKNRSEAAEKDFEAGGKTPEAQEKLIDWIGTGNATIDRLSGLLNNPRGQALLERVVAKYPGFSVPRIKAYVQAVNDFTDTRLGTAGGNLRTVGGALGQLEKLKKLNHTFLSSTYGTEANTAYKDMVHNVAPEIAKFLGTSTEPGIKNIENELLSTTTGNRDSAILTQTQALGDVIDQYDQSWRNAAPSAAYLAPMPGLSDEVKDARARLDPQYANRRTEKPQLPGGGQAPPSGSAPKVAYDKQGNKYTQNSQGQYVDAQGNPYRY